MFVIGILFGIFFAALGFFFIIVGSIIMKSTENKKRKCTAQVEAVIVDLKIKRLITGAEHYSPIYEYFYNGAKYFKEDHIGTYSSVTGGVQMKVGQQIPIFINPRKPDQVYISYDDSSVRRIFSVAGKIYGIIAIIVGVIFVLSGIFCTIMFFISRIPC